jgi:hypothetical protein
MKNNIQNAGIIRWTARTMGIAFAVFISIFAMDVFSEGYSFWEIVLVLFMHLIPTFLVILVLIFSWKREWIGGVAFLILDSYYVFTKWGKIDWSGFAMISIPLFTLAILFFISWYQRKHQQV